MMKKVCPYVDLWEVCIFSSTPPSKTCSILSYNSFLLNDYTAFIIAQSKDPSSNPFFTGQIEDGTNLVTLLPRVLQRLPSALQMKSKFPATWPKNLHNTVATTLLLAYKMALDSSNVSSCFLFQSIYIKNSLCWNVFLSSISPPNV